LATLDSINVGGNKTLTLPVGTSAQRPRLPQAGMARLNSDYSPPILEIYDGSSWKLFTGKYDSGVGLTQSSPADKPDDILDAYPEAADGLYWINVSGTARQIYCDMRNGGWMLAARFNNSSSNIKTYAWLWSDNGNMRVRWCLGFRHNYLEEYYYHTNGLRGIFSDTPYITTNINWNVPRGTRHTRQDFEEWFNKSIDISGTSEDSYTGRAYVNGAGSNFWSNCNMRGVNTAGNSGGVRIRFGTQLNNETQCSSNDYYWGMGITGSALGSVSVGRRANYDGGGYRQTTTNMTGWCFVK